MAKKILIVDDDELTLRLLRSRLEAAGHKVWEAENGEAAIKQALLKEPDVIIMDIMLPDMQGSDAVGLIQQRTHLPEMKIIFLSGIISRSDEDEQKIHVAKNFYPAVAKPIDFERLATLL